MGFVDVYGYLWVSMGLYTCLWVSMSSYRCFWILWCIWVFMGVMGVYRCLWRLMDFRVSMGMGIYLNIKNITYFSHSRAPEDLKTPKNVWNHKCVIKKNVCTTGERDFIDSSIKSLFPPWCIIHYNYINKLEVVVKKIAANGLRKKGSQNIVFRRRNARKSERLYPPPPSPRPHGIRTNDRRKRGQMVASLKN